MARDQCTNEGIDLRSRDQWNGEGRVQADSLNDAKKR